MNEQALMELAAQSAPALMDKTAQAMGLLERLAPDFLPEVTGEMRAISTFTQEKLATVPLPAGATSFGATMKGVAIGTAAVLAAELGRSVATDLYDAARRGLTKGSNFRRMMAANPDMKKEVSHPDRIKPAFDALHKYAPEFTADPIVAGSLVRSLASMDAMGSHQRVMELIDKRKALLETKQRQFNPDFNSVATNLMRDRSAHELESRREGFQSAMQSHRDSRDDAQWGEQKTHQTNLALLNIKARTVEGKRTRDFQAGQNTLSRSFQGGENDKNRTHQSGENDKNRTHQNDLQDRREWNAIDMADRRLADDEQRVHRESHNQAVRQAAYELYKMKSRDYDFAVKNWQAGGQQGPKPKKPKFKDPVK